MSRSLPLIIGLIAAGAVGALVASFAAPSHDTAADPGPEVARLAAELSDVTDRMDRMAREMSELREAPPMAVAPSTAVDDPLPAGTAPGDAPAAIAPEEFDSRVREVVEESRMKQFEAMGSGFRAMAKERQNRMLDNLTENNGLTGYQRDQLDTILTKRQEAVGEFFRSMFGGGEQPDMTELRTKLQEVQASTDEEIQALLNPDQFEAFQSQDRMGRGGGFMMGGGGPGRGR